MTKVTNFKPSRDVPVDLSTDISFTITDLKRLDSQTVTDSPPNTIYESLKYEEASRLYKDGQALFINVKSETPLQVKSVVDDQTLTKADDSIIIEELQASEKVKKTILNNLSSVTYISFEKLNSDQRTTSTLDRLSLSRSDYLDYDYFNNQKISLTSATKGKLLELATNYKNNFDSNNKIKRSIFTYCLITNSYTYCKLEKVENNTITLSGNILFRVGEYITLSNLTSAFKDRDLTNYVENANNYSPRDVLTFVIKNIDYVNKTLELEASMKWKAFNGSLFSSEEIDVINNKKHFYIATSGLPILYAEPLIESKTTWSNPLVQIEEHINDEIPYTNLYAQRSSIEESSGRYLGNLDVQSLQVTLVDDSKEAELVSKGEAQPGVSISYNFQAKSTDVGFGNVNVLLKMQAIPALIRITLGNSSGTNTLKLDARIRRQSTDVAKQTALQNLLDLATLDPKKNDGLRSAEYYFNYQASIQQNQTLSETDPITGELKATTTEVIKKVDLYKYGTIRINEPIEILDENKNPIETVEVLSIDTTTSTIILKDNLTRSIKSGYYLKIPQTPLNPNREYRVRVSCKDRLGTQNTSEMKEFSFKTKPLPQMQGVDGTYWEKVNYASFPPSLDISIPDSFANSISASITQIESTVASLTKTLEGTTQLLQNTACSVGSFVDSIKKIQDFADSFADQQNKTQIYARPIGLDPMGSINSQTSFLNEVKRIVYDTESSFPLPKLEEALIPLDPFSISSVLGGANLPAEQLGQADPAGYVGKKLKDIAGKSFIGSNKRKLSNDINFMPISKGGGFPSSTISYKILTIKKDETIAVNSIVKGGLVYIEKSSMIDTKSITITGAANSKNNGTFEVTNVQIQDVLGKQIVILKFNNKNVVTETNPEKAFASFPNVGNIKASDAIRMAFEKEGYFSRSGTITRLPLSSVLKLLIKHKIVGLDPQQLTLDSSIASERLSLLATEGTNRIGGIVLVGKAEDPLVLASKLQGIAEVMDFLKPLADKISTQAVLFESSKSGINFDKSEIAPRKLNASNNVAIRDVEAVDKKIQESNVKNYKPKKLKTFEENPSFDNFNAWRKYTPIQLIPSLAEFGDATDSKIASLGGSAFKKIIEPFQGVPDALSNGPKRIQTLQNQLGSLSNRVTNLTNDINEMNDRITTGINTLKNLISRGNFSIDAHLIGANLDLTTNSALYNSIEKAFNDFSDPNRPTFGSPIAPSFLSTQNRIKGVVAQESTTLWFGIVLVVVGEDSNDLGEQLRFLTGLLAMDDSKIALPKKPTLTLSGLKI